MRQTHRNHPYKAESFHDTAHTLMTRSLKLKLDAKNSFAKYQPAWTFMESLRCSGYCPQQAVEAVQMQQNFILSL